MRYFDQEMTWLGILMLSFEAEELFGLEQYDQLFNLLDNGEELELNTEAPLLLEEMNKENNQ